MNKQRRFCRNCATELHLGDNWSPAQKTGRMYRCLPCYARVHAPYNEEYRSKNRQKARDAWKNWRDNNPEKYKEKLERDRLRRILAKEKK